MATAMTFEEFSFQVRPPCSSTYFTCMYLYISTCICTHVCIYTYTYMYVCTWHVRKKKGVCCGVLRCELQGALQCAWQCVLQCVLRCALRCILQCVLQRVLQRVLQCVLRCVLQCVLQCALQCVTRGGGISTRIHNWTVVTFIHTWLPFSNATCVAVRVTGVL